MEFLASVHRCCTFKVRWFFGVPCVRLVGGVARCRVVLGAFALDFRGMGARRWVGTKKAPGETRRL